MPSKAQIELVSEKPPACRNTDRQKRATRAGLAQVEAAKADGRWQDAYAGSATMKIPDNILEALEIRPAAKAFFGKLNRTNLYAIHHRLQTAKRPDTRAKRLTRILDQLDRGERFH